MVNILKGAPVADAIYEELSKMNGASPLLSIIKYKGTDAGGYLKGLTKSANRVNARLQVTEVEHYDELLKTVKEMGANDCVSGVLLLKPFPKDWNFREAVKLLPPNKDVDALHPVNFGLLAQNLALLMPATPQSIIQILDFYNIPIEGKNILVIGRSEAVGLPAALMLLHRNGTVTIAHSRTKDIPSLSVKADILVVAIGKAHFVNETFVKNGAVVIDVGTNMTDDGKVVGDVDFDSVMPLVSAITPVPGGVGSVTTACLFKNLFTCYYMNHSA